VRGGRFGRNRSLRLGSHGGASRIRRDLRDRSWPFFVEVGQARRTFGGIIHGLNFGRARSKAAVCGLAADHDR
jgi:hypothetical protein